MTVTKRTRFEVLRRDEHACQYCGAKAPDVVLQIDHVLPVALGGDDKPGNLVTACRDCNSGKTSISPDAPMVQSLSTEAAAYALGMVDKMTRFRADIEAADEFVTRFEEVWKRWSKNGSAVALPPDYEMSLHRWHRMGVPFRALELAIPKAMTKAFLRGDYAEFQYFAGVVWGMVNDREIDYAVTDQTVVVYTEQEVDAERRRSYREGWLAGANDESVAQVSWDFLRHHIDRTVMEADANGRYTRNADGTLTGRVVRVA